MKNNSIIQIEENQFTLHVKVQPKGSKNAWGAAQNNERILLKITAPPVEGAANQFCIQWIASQFKTAKSKVSLRSGEKSRLKTFIVKDYDKKSLNNFIKTHLPTIESAIK